MKTSKQAKMIHSYKISKREKKIARILTNNIIILYYYNYKSRPPKSN